MLPRERAAAGLAAAATGCLETTIFGLGSGFATAVVCFGVEAGFFDVDFFADCLTDFLAVFFAAGFLAVFFVFLTTFFVFFAAALPFFARFFAAAALAAETFFAFFFLKGFFLATTNSL